MGKQIFIFGDSIAHGASDPYGGWTQRLRNYLYKKGEENPKAEYVIYELGVSGDNSDDLLKRFEQEVTARIDPDYDEENIILFAIGINDAQFVYSKNDLRISSEKFEKNVINLIETAKKYSSTIIFVEPTRVEESKTSPIPWNTDKSYENKNIKSHNTVLKNITAERNLEFIKLFDVLTDHDLEDGLHPNENGHGKMFEVIKNYLIEKNIL